MANPFVHVELNTTDVGKAKDFYGKLFDWKLEDMAGGMDYTLINVGEGTAGGIMKHPMPGRSVVLAGLCPGGRHPRRHRQVQVAGRNRGEGCHRGAGYGLVQHLSRSHRSLFCDVAGESEVTLTISRVPTQAACA